MRPWVAVHCQGSTCDRQGGRILFRQCGQLALFKIRGQGFIGPLPVIALCRCGWVWRNRDLALVHDGQAIIDELKGVSA